MPYENQLDVQLFSKSLETDSGKLIVSVCSYNNGPKKLQLSREVKGHGGESVFAKLGRLSKEEVEGIIPIVKEALNHM